MTANRMTGGTVGSVRHHGDVTANLLQHGDWQREALRQSAARRALRSGGEPSPAKPVAARRVTAAIGGTLIRLGTRLQGRPRPAAATPAR